MLRKIIALQPINQAAWLWLSAVTENKNEAESALTQARKINSAHPAIPKAEQWLAKRFSTKNTTKETPIVSNPSPKKGYSPNREKSPNLFNILGIGLAIGAILIAVTALILGVFFEFNTTSKVRAKEENIVWTPLEASPSSLPNSNESPQAFENWTATISAVNEIHQNKLDVTNLKLSLAEEAVQNGSRLRRQGLIEEAHLAFEQASSFGYNSPYLALELRLAESFLRGKVAYQNGEWTKAINGLNIVYQQAPDYPNVQELLFSAYYNEALALHANENLLDAKIAIEAAIDLRPELTEPRQHLAEIKKELASNPSATDPTDLQESDQLILVGIAEQRMHVYDGNDILFDFIVSTGEPGRDTAIGEFEIQNKIDMAYASTWNLDMPFWMGIYWAGPLQNGIHSLPTVRHSGYTLWDGYLGQRVSYGCVILGHEDAETLYDWAEVGTKVKIVPSLATWSNNES